VVGLESGLGSKRDRFGCGAVWCRVVYKLKLGSIWEERKVFEVDMSVSQLRVGGVGVGYLVVDK
jgi:hypothetical protein